MRLSPRALIARDVCDERRPRRHGYQLRCLEPAGHDGPHRWHPELVEHASHRDRTRPAAVRRLGRILEQTRSTLRP
jgi:hypothetical protein